MQEQKKDERVHCAEKQHIGAWERRADMKNVVPKHPPKDPGLGSVEEKPVKVHTPVKSTTLPLTCFHQGVHQ